MNQTVEKRLDGASVGDWIRNNTNLLLMFALIIVGALTSDNFFSMDNILNVLRRITVNGMLAVACTMTLLVGGFDLSIGHVMALSAVLCIGFEKSTGSGAVGIVVALAAGLVLLIAALPRLAVLLPAGVQRVDAALAARFVPRYEARLASLQAENTALHKHLAGAQAALAENDALRQWAGIERPAGRWQAARVVFRWHDHAELAGVYPVGAAVCDEQGRFAGRITEAGADRCTLTFAGYLSPAAAGFAGEQAGLLQKNWRLTGLPLPTTLAAGTVVTTADGLWLGTLAGIPAPAADGLSAEAPLTDTADLGSQVFFIKI